MTTSPPPAEANDIPVQIFEKFLDALSESGLSSELVARLRKTLIEDHVFTERELKTAIIEEEQKE